MLIVKRDGTQVQFDRDKIINAINKAFIEVDGKLRTCISRGNILVDEYNAKPSMYDECV